MEPVVQVAAGGGVKLVENNEPCLAVLANFLAPIVQWQPLEGIQGMQIKGLRHS